MYILNCPSSSLIPSGATPSLMRIPSSTIHCCGGSVGSIVVEVDVVAGIVVVVVVTIVVVGIASVVVGTVVVICGVGRGETQPERKDTNTKNNNFFMVDYEKYLKLTFLRCCFTSCGIFRTKKINSKKIAK